MGFVAANIVEGFGKYPPKERAQFLRIAPASLTQLGYCVRVARRLDYITEDDKTDLDREMRRVAAPLRGLLRSS